MKPDINQAAAPRFFLPKGPLILASGSRTRHQMLANAGMDFVTHAPNIDEISVRHSATASGMPAEDIAVLLADMKAHKAAQAVMMGDVEGASVSGFVLGSDQILFCEGEILAKPTSEAEAVEQLGFLAGKDHHLLTAAVIYQNNERIWHHLAKPCLSMRKMDADFIARYVAAIGDSAFYSAGSYQIEGYGAHLFSAIKGCSYAVMGLPLLEVLGFLRVRGLVLGDVGGDIVGAAE